MVLLSTPLHLSRRVGGRVVATVSVSAFGYWQTGPTQIVHAPPELQRLVGQNHRTLTDAMRTVNTMLGVSNDRQGGFEAYVVGDFDGSLLGTHAGHHFVRGVRNAAPYSPQLVAAQVDVRREEDGSGRWVHWRDLTPLVPAGTLRRAAEDEMARQIRQGKHNPSTGNVNRYEEGECGPPRKKRQKKRTQVRPGTVFLLEGEAMPYEVERVEFEERTASSNGKFVWVKPAHPQYAAAGRKRVCDASLIDWTDGRYAALWRRHRHAPSSAEYEGLVWGVLRCVQRTPGKLAAPLFRKLVGDEGAALPARLEEYDRAQQAVPPSTAASTGVASSSAGKERVEAGDLFVGMAPRRAGEGASSSAAAPPAERKRARDEAEER